MSDQAFSMRAGRTLIEVHRLRGLPELVRVDVHLEADHGDEDDWTTTDMTPDQARELGEALVRAAASIGHAGPEQGHVALVQFLEGLLGSIGREPTEQELRAAAHALTVHADRIAAGQRQENDDA